MSNVVTRGTIPALERFDEWRRTAKTLCSRAIMKKFPAVLTLCISATTLFAMTAKNLSSFEGIEEPSVKYLVASNSFVPDSFTNITDAGGNTARMTLRYHANDWWD